MGIRGRRRVSLKRRLQMAELFEKAIASRGWKVRAVMAEEKTAEKQAAWIARREE